MKYLGKVKSQLRSGQLKFFLVIPGMHFYLNRHLISGTFFITIYVISLQCQGKTQRLARSWIPHLCILPSLYKYLVSRTIIGHICEDILLTLCSAACLHYCLPLVCRSILPSHSGLKMEKLCYEDYVYEWFTQLPTSKAQAAITMALTQDVGSFPTSSCIPWE